MAALAYNRVLLKLSGEALAGEQDFGFDFKVVNRLADEVHGVYDMGVSLGLVIGGGNIVRGAEFSQDGMDRKGYKGDLVQEPADRGEIQGRAVPGGPSERQE